MDWQVLRFFVKKWIGMKTLIFVMVYACVFASCKNAQSGEYQRENATCNIDLSKMDSPFLEKYFSKIELIPLETSDMSLIKDVRGFVYHKKNFYVFDDEQKIVCAFDTNGRFLYKIDKRGNGPGEYTDLSAFQFNRFTGDLELLSPMGGILKYDSPGQIFKGKIPLPLTVSATHDFISLNKDTYLFFCEARDGNKMVVYDASQQKIVKEMYDLPEFLFFNTPYHHTYSPFYVYDDKVHFVQGYNGDVFTLEDNSLMPKYRWDFGEQNFDISSLEEKPIEYYIKYMRNVGSKYANIFITYGENSKYYLSGFLFNNKTCTLIYDKKSGKCNTLNTLEEGHRCTPRFVDEEAVYSLGDAADINIYVNREALDDVNGKIYDDIVKEDNPVIIKYTFK